MTKWVTGTATSDQDLYAKLITFLTTDADLVLANENWSKVWSHAGGDEPGVVLEGPGLSQTDTVYVGMRLLRSVPDDEYTLETRGMTGFQPTALELEDHVNVTTDEVNTYLDSGSMTYWFIANGRRFIVIAKVTTVFEALYAGFFLPFGTPTEYPYPMFIGGSAGKFTGDTSVSPSSWRDNVTGHSQFPFPGYDNVSLNDKYNSPSWVLDPNGDWLRLSNFGVAAQGTVGPVRTRGNRWLSSDTALLFNPFEGLRKLTDCYGGDKFIQPLTLHTTSGSNQTLGVLDGCYKCQGHLMGAEDLITVGGVDHLVVQNTFRTDFEDYWCVELPA